MIGAIHVARRRIEAVDFFRRIMITKVNIALKIMKMKKVMGRDGIPLRFGSAWVIWVCANRPIFSIRFCVNKMPSELRRGA